METTQEHTAAHRLKIILYQPEIPQNTGNIGRLCAVIGAELHLVHPLGFTITDRHLKRSGMDYWKDLPVFHHPDWESLLASADCPRRIWLVTTQAKQSFWDAKFQVGDGLLFGKESAGCPPVIHQWAGEQRITVPRFQQSMRSLNLSTCVGIVAYEAVRQIHVSGDDFCM